MKEPKKCTDKIRLERLIGDNDTTIISDDGIWIFSAAHTHNMKLNFEEVNEILNAIADFRTLKTQYHNRLLMEGKSCSCMEL